MADAPRPLAAAVAVDVPVEEAWAALVDWADHAAWVPLTTVEVTGGDGAGVGGSFVARTGVGPAGFRDPMTITAWEPPRRCRVRKTGRVVRGAAEFRVDPLPDDRARVTWCEEVVPPYGRLGAAAWRVLLPALRPGLNAVLRRFAAHVARTHG